MRRLGVLVVACTVVAWVTACGGSGEDKRPAAPASPAKPATAPAPAPATEPQITAKLVEVNLSVFKFTPKQITLKAGEPVQFRVTSTDTLHTFTVKDLGLDVALNPRESKVTEVFTPQQTGTFQITCRIHSVSSYGMEGFLEVTDTGQPAR
jgi:heme/copper-type cytochrome/quinol oxidase subunit 2